MYRYPTGKILARQPFPGIHPAWKHRGETLFMLLERLRAEGVIAGKATYAGRLDPMADGMVLILTEEARFDKDAYLALDKEYIFTILFGVATDSYDVLGKIEQIGFAKVEIDAVLKAGENMDLASLPYPPYSSRPAQGQPLYAHARIGSLPRDLPQQRGKIISFEVLTSERVLVECVVPNIVTDVQKVEGDFRQEEIVEGWQSFLEQYGKAAIDMVTCKATVTSGAYIRSIAHHIGAKLRTPALAYTITRTRVGEFTAD